MMTSDNLPENEPPQWWLDLSPEQRESILRLTGPNWFPNQEIEEIGRQFDETRRRIREIEERALRRLRK